MISIEGLEEDTEDEVIVIVPMKNGMEYDNNADLMVEFKNKAGFEFRMEDRIAHSIDILTRRRGEDLIKKYRLQQESKNGTTYITFKVYRKKADRSLEFIQYYTYKNVPGEGTIIS